MAAPFVSSINPTSGPGAGGNIVAISGTGFTGATAVTFGSTTATPFIVVSDTQIAAVVPSGVGVVNVVVTNPSGTSNAVTYTYTAAPIVASVSPNSGPVAGGNIVVINGSHFVDATAVTFGSTAATPFIVVSDSQIYAVVPPGPSSGGVVNVLVTSSSGTSAPVTYTYIPAPIVVSVSPTSGPTTGGNSVAINGSHFTGATAVTFGTTAATSFSFVSDTLINAVVPPGPIGGGSVSVRVTSPGGTSAPGVTYTYIPAPIVTSVSPTSGPVAGGNTVFIIGSHFTGATTAKFGSTAATSFTVVSDNLITAFVPPGPIGGGIVPVVVTGPGGTSGTGVTYTYIPAPIVGSVSPNSGPNAGGTTVAISGSGFTGATAVTFGTTAATPFTFVSDTLISAVVPSGPIGGGTVPVLVTGPGGTSAPGVTYTYISAPIVVSVSPTSGPIAGGNTVAINGSHFTGATAVTFGTTAATSFSFVSDTLINAVVPPGPIGGGSVSVRVTGPGGTSAAGVTYTYTSGPAPVVTLVGPSIGPVAGGNTVFIIGSRFTGATTVTFGSTAATSFTVVSDTVISAVAPHGPSGGGSVSVRVTGPGGTSAPSINYTYV
jgi:hypothetical protein